MRDRRGLRVAIFNVKYSPNLGDGVIAECLEDYVGASRKVASVLSIDLAGRTRFDPASGRSRALVLKALEMLPGRLRALLLPIVISAVVRSRLRPEWQRLLRDCDVAVIGGGALLADADQNFPIKLGNAIALCAELGIPVAIAHVGVQRGWSRGGKRTFTSALSRATLVKLTVRDQESIDNFIAEFGECFGRPERALDPGLLACDTYGPVERPEQVSGRKRIGLCITSPLVLRLHGGAEAGTRNLRFWLRAVASLLARSGHEVLLFTNGSPEDEAFADELAADLEAVAHVERAPRFGEPQALVRFIAGLDCVVAHRLHACIVAFSYRIPMVGLVWDRKLGSFLRTVSRERCLIDPASINAEAAALMIESEMDEPFDAYLHASILQDCRQGIAALTSELWAQARRHA